MPCDETLLPVNFKIHQSALHFRLAPDVAGFGSTNGRKWQVLAGFGRDGSSRCKTVTPFAPARYESPASVPGTSPGFPCQFLPFPAKTCHIGKSSGCVGTKCAQAAAVLCRHKDSNSAQPSALTLSRGCVGAKVQTQVTRCLPPGFCGQMGCVGTVGTKDIGPNSPKPAGLSFSAIVAVLSALSAPSFSSFRAPQHSSPDPRNLTRI